MNDKLRAAGLEPLDVSCTTSACEHGLHCFRPRKAGPHGDGDCRDCGDGSIDWGVLHQRDLADVEFTIEVLQLEVIRYLYWTEPLSEHARQYAVKKGFSGLNARVPAQLRTRLGKKKSDNAWDGRQTPGHKQDKANAVDWAQHATATCCRSCVSYWHGIDPDGEITDRDFEYMSDLVMRYLRAKLPEIEWSSDSAERGA